MVHTPGQDGPGDEFPNIRRRLEVVLPREVVIRACAYLREKAVVTARRKRRRGEDSPMHRSGSLLTGQAGCEDRGLYLCGDAGPQWTMFRAF